MSLGKVIPIGSNGLKIPAVGLGTWQSPKGEVRKAVSVAIGAGYRHIDCAWIYMNEGEVGDGIKDSGIEREKLWLTSKLWNSFHHPDKVESTLDDTLKRLQVDYLDLYLMHWPVAFARDGSKVPGTKMPALDWDLTNDPMPTWRAMEALVASGKVREIGISNFNISRAKKLYEQATIKPAVNQVELNLRCAQPELLAWSKKTGILLEAYSPLGSTGAPQLEDPIVQAIAKKHGVSPANILISWQRERGVIVLPKSVTPARIISNFQDVELSKAEVAQLEARAAEQPEQRTVDPSKAWGVDIFSDTAAKL